MNDPDPRKLPLRLFSKKDFDQEHYLCDTAGSTYHRVAFCVAVSEHSLTIVIFRFFVTSKSESCMLVDSKALVCVE